MLVILVLGSCTSFSGTQTTPTADSPTVVIAPTEVAEVASPSASVTATAAAIVTPLSPTATTQRPTPLLTLSPAPTPLADDDIIALIQATVAPQIYGTFPSPDGQWLAEVIVYECAFVLADQENSYEEVRITAVGDETEQVVDTQFLNCGGLGAAGFEGLFWSANSQYFYYTPARDGVPDGCGYWTRPYSRADVASGEMEWLGGGVLSPDGTLLATWQEGQLVVWDLNAGEVGRVEGTVPIGEEGPVVWSPDGRALAYLRSTSFCPAGVATVVRADLPELKEQVLIEADETGFVDLSWDEPGYLTLVTAEGQAWHYDFATSELTTVP